MKFILASILAVASLSAVNAQLAGVSTCILTCTQSSATEAGCTGLTDTGCICTSAAFQNAATACLIASCTTEEQQTAVQLQQQLCAGQSVSGSLSSTISAPSASSSIDGGALSSLASSVGMTSGASASASSVSSAASGAISGASASVSSVIGGASSVLGGASSVAGGVGNSASSGISQITGGGNGAGSKAELNFKWGVLGVGAVGMVMGALVVL